MKKILIVDDEPNNRLLLQELLEDFEEAGVRLIYAADGAEAMHRIRSEKPDLVFLDLMLPETDGFGICHTVKSEPGLDNIFIAVLTAKSQNSDKKRAMEAKADMYITKPFKARAIVDVANKVLYGHSDKD